MSFKIDWSVYEEMRQAEISAPEEYRAHPHWLDYEKKVVSVLKQKPDQVFSLEVDGVPGWVGGGSEHRVPWKHYERYLPFVRELDQLEILKRYPTFKSRQFLDAVAEINLLHQYAGLEDGKLILDLGGGYGRVAEFLLPLFKVSYVVVDAVALSLLVAPQYIAQALKIETNSFWGKKDPVFRNHAFSVWPTWKILDVLPQADIIMNIHSLQEMGDEKCEFYFNLIDQNKKEKARIFLKNNYRYVTRNWKFPKRWKALYQNDGWPCTEGLVDGVWQDEPRTWLKVFE